MAKVGTVVIEVDANTAKLIKGVKESNRRLSALQKSANKTKKAIIGIAAGAAGLYGLGRAFQFLVKSSLDYNIQMENSTVKLNAMISASKGYETVTGRQVDAMERQQMIAAETAETMALLRKANVETAMGITDLIDVFALMKPGMDQANVATKDQVEILKLVTNTASTFSISAQELSTGIDDLALGTWRTTQSFGKMMKAIGVTKDGIKEAGDKVAYLRERMKETGVTQDTWSVAVSNFGVAWDETIGDLTVGIFDQLKKIINDLKNQLENLAPDAMQVFADAIVDMVNGSVKALGGLVKVVYSVANGFKLAYAGYAKIAGAAFGGDVGELKTELLELERILNEKDFSPWSGTQSESITQAAIKAKKEEIAETTKWNKIRAEADDDTEDALKSLIDGWTTADNLVKKFTLTSKKIVPEVEAAAKATDKLKGKTREIAADTKKASKAAKEAATLYRKFLELTGQSEKLFQLDVDDQMQELLKSGKYTMQELSAAYDGMWEEYQEKGQEANSRIVDDISNAVSGLANAYKDGGLSGLGEQIGNNIVDGANDLLPGLGTAFEAIGALFSSSVTGYDIEASRGRIEFDDDSLIALVDAFSDAQYPMLEVTNKMHKHIRNMDANFYAVARALSSEASSGGVDLTGVNFVDTFSEGFLGFSSKTVSLISTGLAFELQSLNDLMSDATLSVRGYTTTLVEESSWFGLSSDSSIRTAFQTLPPEVVSDIADSFASGFEAILLAGTTLGLDAVDLEAALRASELDLEKIDFTGLSPSEVSDRLSQAFSTAFSIVIDGIEDFDGFVESYAQGAEYALETLVRIATEFDQASHSFSLIGKQFTDAFEVLNIVASTGGLTEFQDAMGSFMSNFYTDTEQLEFMTKSMEEAFGTLGLVMPDTNAEFRTLLETMNTSTEEGAYLYGQVLLLADSFSAMSDASANLGTSIEDMISQVSDAWLGNLSYLTLQQKADYASGYLAIAGTSNGAIDTVEAARLAAETALQTTATKEEYRPIFDRYIAELEGQTPESTLNDVVVELRLLKDEIVESRTATIDAYIHTGTNG